MPEFAVGAVIAVVVGPVIPTGVVVPIGVAVPVGASVGVVVEDGFTTTGR